MQKLNKFFITALVAGLVAFSAALAIPTQMAQALIKTGQIENNAITSPKIKDGEVKTPDLATSAVTKEKLNPNAVKLVVIQRISEQVTIAPQDIKIAFARCNSDEVQTGGGFNADADVEVRSSNQGGNGWAASFFNAGDNERTAVAVAECAHLELGP